MAARVSLESEARAFADRISALLNRTVATGVRLSAIVNERGFAAIGLGLSKADPVPAPVPLTIGKAPPSAWLMVTYTLHREDDHLVTTKSSYALYGDEDFSGAVVRFEYERDKLQYPEAHIHANGECAGLDAIFTRRDAKKKTLYDLHLPTGGRRFRVTLEDVVEMLVVEQLADAHEGWEEAVREMREEWERGQLVAAVQRSPEVAREALELLGA